MSLQIGDNAPDFKLADQHGKEHTLEDLRGHTTLIYFYPKDETPGCTTQACSLRDHFEELQAKGIDVIGVSRDDVVSHTKFAENYKLPFSILADPDNKMIDSYGAWGERNMYGRKFMGTIRSGVVVDKDLKIAAVWPKLAPLKTVPEILKWLSSKPS